jgi:hypothetical protein
MKVQQFLAHYHLVENPFGQEDAVQDPVFRRGCIDRCFHPAWDRIMGNPEFPSAAVVFGEKGSGKTALRIQMVESQRKFNSEHPDRRVLILEYDDFNPFLDQFLHQQRNLGRWELRDHIDVVLSLATRKLVEMILSEAPEVQRGQLDELSRSDRRDLLMLAAVYDSSHDTSRTERWELLRRALRFRGTTGGLITQPEFGIGLLGTFIVAGLLGYFQPWELLQTWWWAVLVILAVVWLPTLKLWFTTWRLAARINRSVRVLSHATPDLRTILHRFRRSDLAGQPIREPESVAARYVYLNKLQAVLRKLGYVGIMVIVDRVDEPHTISGDAKVMHQLMRSIFDLKFLKHPGLGIKLLLPGDLYPFVQSEDQQFRDRARLDKQHFIPSLGWTGHSLIDLVNDRLRACSEDKQSTVTLRSLVDDQVSDSEMLNYLERMKIPRHVFKFMYQLIATHCDTHTEGNPEWKISRETWLNTCTRFNNDLERYEKNLIMG